MAEIPGVFRSKQQVNAEEGEWRRWRAIEGDVRQASRAKALRVT